MNVLQCMGHFWICHINFFSANMLSADPRRRGRGRGEGHYAHNCISIRRLMALNLALLNDYRTCKCTMHRHTAPAAFIPVLLYTR